MIANVLSIAGSDPSGGAGIQADLKAFSACGVYGMAALTALTAQNTRGVSGVHPVPPDFVAAQIEAVFADVRVDAVKIGMLGNAAVTRAVAGILSRHEHMPVVLDPVMVAKGGARLLADDAVAALRAALPLASVITPNLPEATDLLDRAPATDRDGMAQAARDLLALGPGAVLLKGGHLDGADSPDCLMTHDGLIWLDGPRTATTNTHGTGCTLSSMLAALLARGQGLEAAAREAKARVGAAITAADRLDVGAGHGPTHPLHPLWTAAGL